MNILFTYKLKFWQRWQSIVGHTSMWSVLINNFKLTEKKQKRSILRSHVVFAIVQWLGLTSRSATRSRTSYLSLVTQGCNLPSPFDCWNTDLKKQNKKNNAKRPWAFISGKPVHFKRYLTNSLFMFSGGVIKYIFLKNEKPQK